MFKTLFSKVLGFLNLEIKPHKKRSVQTIILSDGWIRVSHKDILTRQDVNDLYFSRHESFSEWSNEITTEWLGYLRVYRPDELIRIIHKRRDMEVTEGVLELNRMITASAIYYEFPVPRSMWILDGDTLDTFIKYTIIKHPTIPLVLENHLFPDIPVDNLPEMIEFFRDNIYFTNDVSNIAHKGFRHMPNGAVMYNHIWSGAMSDHPLKKMTYGQFRKIATCYFLFCDIAMPTHLIAIDQEVIDWIHKKGKYAPQAAPVPVEQEGNVYYLKGKRD